MTNVAYRALGEGVAREGLLLPIVTFEKQVIDGLHRLAACMEWQISPSFEAWDGHGSLIAHVANLNANRRHLTAAMRAAIAVELLPWLEKEAKERQRRHGGTAPGRAAGTLMENVPGVSRGPAREVAAKLCRVNSRYVSDLARVKGMAPEVFQKVHRGELKLKVALECINHWQEGMMAGAGQDDEGRRGDPGRAGPHVDPDAKEVEDNARSAVASDTRKGKRRPKNHRSAEDEPASPRWTPQAVEDRLTQLAEWLGRLPAVVEDAEFLGLARQLNPECRARCRERLLACRKALKRLIASLGGEEQ
jgi:hypothetical protein